MKQIFSMYFFFEMFIHISCILITFLPSIATSFSSIPLPSSKNPGNYVFWALQCHCSHDLPVAVATFRRQMYNQARHHSNLCEGVITKPQTQLWNVFTYLVGDGKSAFHKPWQSPMFSGWTYAHKCMGCANWIQWIIKN